MAGTVTSQRMSQIEWKYYVCLYNICFQVYLFLTQMNDFSLN